MTCDTNFSHKAALSQNWVPAQQYILPVYYGEGLHTYIPPRYPYNEDNTSWDAFRSRFSPITRLLGGAHPTKMTASETPRLDVSINPSLGTDSISSIMLCLQAPGCRTNELGNSTFVFILEGVCCVTNITINVNVNIITGELNRGPNIGINVLIVKTGKCVPGIGFRVYRRWTIYSSK